MKYAKRIPILNASLTLYSLMAAALVTLISCVKSEPPPDNQQDNNQSFSTWTFKNNPTPLDDKIIALAINSQDFFLSGVEDSSKVIEKRSALNASTLWRIPADAKYLGANDNLLATSDGTVITVRQVSDGSVLWSKSDSSASGLALNSSFLFSKASSGACPNSGDRALGFFRRDGHTGNNEVAKPQTGCKPWARYGGLFATSQAVYTSLDFGSNINTEDWNISKFTAEGLVQVWSSYITGSASAFSGLIAGDDEQIYSEGKLGSVPHIVSLKSSDGLILWNLELGTVLPGVDSRFRITSLTVTNEGVIVVGGNNDGTSALSSVMFLLSKINGSLIWKLNTFEMAEFALLIGDKIILAGSPPVSEDGGKTQWQIEKRNSADGQFSSTNHGQFNALKLF